MLKLQYFGHLMWRADSLEKIQMLGKIEGRMRRGWPDKMAAGWHHQLNGHEFAKTPGDSEGQGSLECCSPWGHKELDETYWPNNNQQHTQLITSSALNSPLIYNWLILSSLDLVFCILVWVYLHSFWGIVSEFFQPGNSGPLVLKMFIYWWFPPLCFHFFVSRIPVTHNPPPKLVLLFSYFLST